MRKGRGEKMERKGEGEGGRMNENKVKERGWGREGRERKGLGAER